jgi:hypothetical protein
MSTFISDIRSAMQKRAAYRRTVAEIRSMPLDVALDLNIYRGDAEALARRAVYGN